MKTFLALLCSSVIASAQVIEKRSLDSGIPMQVTLGSEATTTLLFPSPVSSAIGVGICGKEGTSGSVQLSHPDGSNILVLHPVTVPTKVLMTVLMNGALYVFELDGVQGVGDVAITYNDKADSAPRGVEVTPDDIKNARPKYDPELLVGLLRRAHDAGALKPLYPDLYADYTSRVAEYSSDNGTIKTVVTSITRFDKDDAIVLFGTVKNESATPVTFEALATTVQVANETHPAKLTDILCPIPPNTTVPIGVVLQGDFDGGRGNISIQNEFRIMLSGADGSGSVWQFKNGSPAKPGMVIPTPKKLPTIPLTQTGNALRKQ